MAKKQLTIEEKLQAALVPVEEQPYKVPENWCWGRLGSVTTRIKRGKSPKYVDESDFPVFAQKCNQKDGTIALEKARFLNPDMAMKLSEEEFLHENDVVINSTGTGTLGRVGFFREQDKLGYEKILPDSHVTVVRPSTIVENFFLYLFLKGKQSFLELQGAGSTNQKELRPATISELLLPLPPQGEQSRIVARIESLFAKLDEAKEKIQEVLDGADLRRAAILHQAFTGKLTEKWRKEKNISIADWKEKTLKDCCRIGSGGTPSRKNPAFYRGDIPWVKTGEINWNELYDTEEHISKEAIDNSSAKLYREGAVLVAMYGMGATRGRAAILRTNATTNQAVCALETKENLLNQFLFYYFMNNYWKIREKAVGGNQLNLSGKIIEKLEVKLPVIEEQQEIVRLLDNLLSREQSTVTACEEALTTIDTLKKSILARAFRGELGTNDPAEPSAQGLLQEILEA